MHLFLMTFCSKLVSLATRMKMTPAEQAAFTQAVIEEAGGDPEEIGSHLNLQHCTGLQSWLDHLTTMVQMKKD